MCVVFCLRVYVCVCLRGLFRQWLQSEEGAESSGTGVQVVVSCRVGAGNWTQVLSKSRQGSQPLSHLRDFY